MNALRGGYGDSGPSLIQTFELARGQGRLKGKQVKRREESKNILRWPGSSVVGVYERRGKISA